MILIETILMYKNLINQISFLKNAHFDDKLKRLNTKLTENKTKNLENEKKLTNLTNKVAYISEKGYDCLFGGIYFPDNQSYHSFLVFPPMLNLLIFDSNKKGNNWVSTRISSENIKPFDTNFEPTMSNLANGRVILKFNNSVLVQKKLFFIVQ